MKINTIILLIALFPWKNLSAQVKDSSDNSKDSFTDNGLIKNIQLLTYSDFKGFKSDRPNGLVQLEFNYSYYLLKHKWYFDTDKNNYFALLYNLFSGIALTKLEDKLRYKQLNYFIDTTKSNEDSIVRHIHTFDLLRYGNFAFSLKLNLAKFSFNKGTMAVYWDVMGKFISSGVVDTLLPDIDRQYNINSYGLGSSFTFATKYKPEDLPLNTSISIELYKLRAHSNDVRQRTGPLYYPENNHKNNNHNTEQNLNPSDTKIIRVQILLTYNPKHINGTGDIFIRFNYSTNSFKVISGNISESNYNNNYLQFQVGYIVPLNGLFPEKNEDKSKKEIYERKENEKFVM